MARSSLFPPSVQPGKPILGSCPDGWTTLTFGDVLRVVERPVALDDDAEYQLVTAKRSRGGVVARSRLKGRDILTKTQFMIERDDFLMSNRQIIHGGCGLVPPALTGAIVSNEYSVLKPTSRLLIDYLAYLTHSIYFQQTCFHASVGVDVEKMIFDCERWLRFKLHLPPLPEQRRIAEVLSSVDEAIAATRVVIEQTRKVKQAVLERLLTKGIGHTRFKQTEIGEIPEEWALKSICDIALVKAGATPSRALHDRYFQGGAIPWVKTGDLTDGVVGRTEEMITAAAVAESSCEIHPAGTVLVAMYGGFQQIGRSGILEQPSATNQAISALRICDETVLGPYLNCALVGLRSKWRSVAASSRKDPNITKNDVLRFSIPVPPVTEQKKIVKILDGFENSQRAIDDSLTRLLECKSALMSDLLTGRKRVTDALPLAAE
ncbi:restriction endonuclease subunit S [Xanthobacter autotrophicus]|uniref:restriction endonuclease subunit S n=1 Tax=Xanthobacter autotrophicus TaxID=280 RepID=UPI00372ADFA0